MPLITTSVPNLVQGVSQQPDNLRHPGQATIQENAVSSVVEGLKKRPPTEYVAKLIDEAVADNAFMHVVKRSDTEQYLVIVTEDGGVSTIKVYSLDKSWPAGATAIIPPEFYYNQDGGGYNPDTLVDRYLDCASPVDDLRAITIQDHTFLINTTKQVSMNPTSYDGYDVIYAPASATFMGKLRTKAAGGDFLYDIDLPTSAQWDYACKAGSSGRFFWGDDASTGTGSTYAHGLDNTGWVGSEWDDDDDGLPNVGTLLANDFGLYDMMGLVWEQTLDLAAWMDSYETRFEGPPQNDPCTDEVTGDSDNSLDDPGTLPESFASGVAAGNPVRIARGGSVRNQIGGTTGSGLVMLRQWTREPVHSDGPQDGGADAYSYGAHPLNNLLGFRPVINTSYRGRYLAINVVGGDGATSYPTSTTSELYGSEDTNRKTQISFVWIQPGVTAPGMDNRIFDAHTTALEVDATKDWDKRFRGGDDGNDEFIGVESVELDGFYMAIYPVTKAQYQYVMGFAATDAVSHKFDGDAAPGGDYSSIMTPINDGSFDAVRGGEWPSPTFPASLRTKLSSLSGDVVDEALVFIKQGDYGKNYSVKLKVGLTEETSSTESGGATSASNADAGVIMDNLKDALVINGAVEGVDFGYFQEGGVIKIEADGVFAISVFDGLANTGLGVVHNEVDSIADLPLTAPKGFRVKVLGDLDLAQDDYYVRFETHDGQDFGTGTWVETTDYDTLKEYDLATMPVILANTGDDEFELRQGSYGLRAVGDDTSNPVPSFVDGYINGAFLFKNRLGFFSGENIVMSETGFGPPDTSGIQQFNFFRTTVLSLLDGDPIDVGINHNKISTLNHAASFQEKLLLFSEETQFVLRGRDLLTPSTVSITPVTEYDNLPGVAPQGVGDYLYFPFGRGDYSGIMEYAVDANADVFNGAEITAQAPSYVPKEMRLLTGSPSERIIVAAPKASEDDKTLYVYSYFWSNREKIQSSWSKFTFSHEVVHVHFVENILWVVTRADSKTFVEKIVFGSGSVDTGVSYKTLLDRRIDGADLAGTSTYGGGITTITGIPYDTDGVSVVTKAGVTLVVTEASSSSVTVPGDHSTGSWWLGFPYTMTYQFSNPTIKLSTDKGGKTASNFVKQQLRNGAVEYAESGAFQVEVTPYLRDPHTYTFAAAAEDTPEDGSFRFPVMTAAKDVKVKVISSSALPCKLLAGEFESFVHERARRFGG